MKIRIIALVLSIAFLASCSSSRYGRIPKAKKQKHVVAKKQFRKKKVKQTEEISAKKPIVAIEIQTPQLSSNNIVVEYKTQTKATQKNNKTTVPTAVQNVENRESIQQILKPNKTQKIEKETKNQEVKKGSWLYYVVVGIVLLLVGGLIGTIIGWLLVVAGTLAIIYGLLVLLGIF